MAIVKKGSRRIVVDGIEYRWRIRQKPTYYQSMGWSGLTCSVDQTAEKSGAVLLVSLSRLHPNRVMREIAEPVLPSEVVTWIRQALAKGWQSQYRANHFYFCHLSQTRSSRIT